MKTLNAISLFSGTAMLDRGTAAALETIGYRLKTSLYCDNQPHCQDVLNARMQDGSIEEAPIWADVTTLHLHGLEGTFDAIVAGFPCQPFSLMGDRTGIEDERYLFGDILRLAKEGCIPLLFLENVAAVLSSHKEAVSPFSDVLRLLAEDGFSAKWVCVRADEAGATHRRERFFCIAWRDPAMANGPQE